MSFKQAKVLEIRADGEAHILERVPLEHNHNGLKYDEAYIETLLFNNPDILPISEIDSAYTDPVAVCTQLSTKAGILDILFITRSGRIVILEAKLWRNPESKRKVIAQILDYASELTRWSFEDLEREVSRRLGKGKQSLFRQVWGDGHDEQEAQFVDEVARNLRSGRFLLLICGDGIREGLSNIAEFLEDHTTLDFTFGLIEVAIYGTSDGGYLVHPRVLANSVTLRRQVIRIEGSRVTVEDEQDDVDNIEDVDEQLDLSDRKKLLLEFWTYLAKNIQFDDATQMPPNPGKQGFVKLKLSSAAAWITLYFDKGKGKQGLFLTFRDDAAGNYFYKALCEEREQIEQELPDIQWSDYWISMKRDAPDISTKRGQKDALEWFQTHANQFVNTFRPRIARYQDEI